MTARERLRNPDRAEPILPANGAAAHREIALIVCTYKRPAHLELCLESIAVQTAIDTAEVIVSDDGSSDATQDVVRKFAQRGICPVRFVTQDHDGFRVARVRNNAVSTTRAPYLVFIDGDCVVPPDHLERHQKAQADGVAVLGDHVNLTAESSRQINVESARGGDLWQYADRPELLRIRRKARKDRVYSLIGIPMRPRLTANNFGMWRADFERVNGFDENYVGWGLEDTDLQRRLAMIGVRFHTILHRTTSFHLWHPREPTFRRNSSGTANRAYFEREELRPACRLGLRRTGTGDFTVIPMTASFSKNSSQSLCDAA